MNNEVRAAIFVRALKAWFDEEKRILPWRDIRESDDDKRAYLVLVSEIMLQQTQVPRVIELYQKFVHIFPDAKALSQASNADVLRAWKGLGYNSRALRLRDAARIITSEYAGHFPRTLEELMQIKGIGEYTAGAILNFAFDIPTPCIDVNIRRIVHRLFFGPEDADGTFAHSDRELLPLVALLLTFALEIDGFSPKDIFGALMDFGSSLCTKSSPKWDAFPDEMKKVFVAYGSEIKRIKKVNKKEPGEVIAGVFTPERILRGRIVDFLRQHPASRQQIGKAVIEDWSKKRDAWLQQVLRKLEKDEIVQQSSGKYHL